MLRVRNVEDSLPFYGDVLGLQVRDQSPRAAYFTWGGQHYVIYASAQHGGWENCTRSSSGKQARQAAIS